MASGMASGMALAASSGQSGTPVFFFLTPNTPNASQITKWKFSLLLEPRLQDAAPGGIGDGILLFCPPGFCDVWGSFARAFLLGRLENRGLKKKNLLLSARY